MCAAVKVGVVRRYQAAVTATGAFLVILGLVYPITATRFANPDIPLLYLSSAALVTMGVSLLLNSVRTAIAEWQDSRNE